MCALKPLSIAIDHFVYGLVWTHFGSVLASHFTTHTYYTSSTYLFLAAYLTQKPDNYPLCLRYFTY